MPRPCSNRECSRRALLKRPKTGDALCRECFFAGEAFAKTEIRNYLNLLGGQQTIACQYDPCKMSSSFEAMGIETGPSA